MTTTAKANRLGIRNPGNRRFPDELIETIRDLWINAGLTLHQIARKVGLTAEQVRHIRRRYKLPPRQPLGPMPRQRIQLDKLESAF